MVDKKFFKAVAIERWVVVVYEQQRRFNDKSAQDVICQRRIFPSSMVISFGTDGLCGRCCDVGIKLAPTPFVDIDRQMAEQKAAGTTAQSPRSASSFIATAFQRVNSSRFWSKVNIHYPYSRENARTMWSGNPLKGLCPFDTVLYSTWCWYTSYSSLFVQVFVCASVSVRSRVSFPPSETTGA
ncbi:hypothetical protein K438DRAFT_79970 [Mycena galopus ATCC 62051]|nr:hypothetical protein K438DRAFT_79970 [Mycena galopus ATCC 62051]